MVDSEGRGGRGRSLSIGLVGLALLVGGAVWYGATAYYELAPGEAAVVLRLGAYERTETRQGIHFLSLPRPLEELSVVNVGERKRIEFGDVDATEPEKVNETAMQTGDNNVVLVEFAVQYRVGRPFESRYLASEPDDTLWDVAQAAMREVVGRDTVDGVLIDRKSAIAGDAAELMQQMLDHYESGLIVESVQIQDAQPPKTLRASFNDALGARQDRTRQVNEAQGYANEIVPKARGEAAELTASAAAYRRTRVAEATGEAARFKKIVVEYQRAPQITRKRLYLETLEAVLPAAEKVVAERGSATVVPYLPLPSKATP